MVDMKGAMVWYEIQSEVVMMEMKGRRESLMVHENSLQSYVMKAEENTQREREREREKERESLPFFPFRAERATSLAPSS